MLRDRPRRGKTGREGLTRDQRLDLMGKDLAEIREAIEGAMKEMAKLKDHVDYQLDLRAPFAFLPFNQITQALVGGPLISATSGGTASSPAPYPFVQVDP